MFRLVYDALARLFVKPRSGNTSVADLEIAREVQTPDPYVWRLPSPYDARWRRWSKRSRAAGHRLPFPHDEECWQSPPPALAPLWESSDDVVRPYVLKR
ncbi:hypothetical protein [Streptomyces roseochromogenus]|uniref:hypothetical protein n=1 Tax=Streptomyces roseochromogenus TaxID=285450 RepID=UPI000A4DB6E9|nr:hypothetical protein [Streptomyces roseochromogenus]